MATDFSELFQRERAFWQIDALQDIVDIGQDVTYSGLEAAFIELWTALVPGTQARFKNFLTWLYAQVPESKVSTHAMLGSVRQWADFEMGEALERFRVSVARWLHKTVADSAKMFGEKATEAAGRYVSPQLKANLRFSAVNREAVDWAERRSGALITGIDNVMRRNISLILANSMAGAATPVQVARDIYTFIPLLPTHTAALIKQRAKMTAQKPANVSQAQWGQQVNDIIGANAARYRRYRATNIARTETIMANNYGVNAYMLQKQEAGLLPGTSMRVWIATRDDKTCPRCAPMHGKVSPLEGYWRAPGAKAGTEVILAIPPLHPSCRCAIALYNADLHTADEIETMWAPIHA